MEIGQIDNASVKLEYQPNKVFLNAEKDEGKQFNLGFVGKTTQKKKDGSGTFEQLVFVDETGDLFFLALWAIRNAIKLEATKKYLLTAKNKRFSVVPM
jgi:hypothetical protein